MTAEPAATPVTVAVVEVAFASIVTGEVTVATLGSEDTSVTVVAVLCAALRATVKLPLPLAATIKGLGESESVSSGAQAFPKQVRLTL